MHHHQATTTCRECSCWSGGQSWSLWCCDISASATARATCGVQNQIQVVCIELMHQIHTGRAPQYLVDSVQSVVLNPAVDPVWGPPTLPTTSNAALVRSLVNVVSVMLVQLPDSVKPTTDTNRFKSLLKSHLFRLAFRHFVSASRRSVRRTLDVLFVFVLCWYLSGAGAAAKPRCSSLYGPQERRRDWSARQGNTALRCWSKEKMLSFFSSC